MSRYLTAMTASYVAMGGVAFCLAYVAVMLPESLSQQSRLLFVCQPLHPNGGEVLS